MRQWFLFAFPCIHAHPASGHAAHAWIGPDWATHQRISDAYPSIAAAGLLLMLVDRSWHTRTVLGNKPGVALYRILVSCNYLKMGRVIGLTITFFMRSHVIWKTYLIGLSFGWIGGSVSSIIANIFLSSFCAATGSLLKCPSSNSVDLMGIIVSKQSYSLAYSSLTVIKQENLFSFCQHSIGWS